METVAKERRKAAAHRPLGKTVRVLTQAELMADMDAHGRKVRKTKQSAVAFLQQAGIVGDDGQLAPMYRS